MSGREWYGTSNVLKHAKIQWVWALSLKCHFPCDSGSFPCPLEDGDTVDRHNWNLKSDFWRENRFKCHCVLCPCYIMRCWSVSVPFQTFNTVAQPFRESPSAPRTSAIPSWCFGRVVRSPLPWQNSSNCCPPPQGVKTMRSCRLVWDVLSVSQSHPILNMPLAPQTSPKYTYDHPSVGCGIGLKYCSQFSWTLPLNFKKKWWPTCDMILPTRNFNKHANMHWFLYICQILIKHS